MRWSWYNAVKPKSVLTATPLDHDKIVNEEIAKFAKTLEDIQTEELNKAIDMGIPQNKRWEKEDRTVENCTVRNFCTKLRLMHIKHV